MKYLLGLLLVALASGCGNKQGLDIFVDYQTRIARVLDVKTPELDAISRLPLPKRRDMQHSIPATTVSLRDFYRLDGCFIKPIIAKRNTTVGKLQGPSQRLQYEYQLITALEQCIANNKDNQTLLSLTATKRRQLALVWANMISQSDEMITLFTGVRGEIQGHSGDGLEKTLQALAVVKLSRHGDEAILRGLESQLQILQQTALISKISQTQRILAQQLRTTTQWLNSHKETLRCDSEYPKQQKIRYLENIFQRYFVAKLQPYASQLNRYHYQLSPVLAPWKNDPLIAPGLKQFLTQFDNDFATYQTAMQQHIASWQSLYANCGLTPGNSL